MLNRVILMGRITADPELKQTPNGISVVSFSLAVERSYTSKGAERVTDFINCVVWRRQAENLAKYCRKGSQIAVEGRIQTRNYTAQDGSKRYVTEVMCDNITFLGSKADSGSASNFDNNYQAPSSYPTNDSAPSMPTTDISEDPFKDFGEEITLSDDDLPF